jgi:Uma2 family endonuclease
MSNAAKKRTVYEEFLAAPPHMVAEIINGTVRTQARPASRHARAASRLGMRLGSFDGDGGDGGWIILDEPELHLLGHVLVPDLAAWRRSRMPELPDAPFFELAPDWVCEVLSHSSTAATDRVEKMPIYAQADVSHVWLIDPIAKTLEAFGLDRDGERRKALWRVLGTWRDGASVSAPPFDSLPLDLSALWAR